MDIIYLVGTARRGKVCNDKMIEKRCASKRVEVRVTVYIRVSGVEVVIVLAQEKKGRIIVWSGYHGKTSLRKV